MVKILFNDQMEAKQDAQDKTIIQLAWEHKDKMEFVGIEALDELSHEKLGKPLSSITARK